MIRDWMDVGPVGNNPFSSERSAQTDGQRDTERPEEEGLQTYNTDSIPPIISLQGQQLGRLVTLDLKGNDIRVRFGIKFSPARISSLTLQGGVNYIAQVLKRNTHLKVLNLSENRIDSAGLASIAEALVSLGHRSRCTWLIKIVRLQRLNRCLETLDISHNPCSGVSLDGVSTPLQLSGNRC
jgi:protein phosphatase 1 regulatory subunit 37